MSDNELTRFDTIRKLDERHLTRAQAAELLGISVRQVQRIINRYRSDGIEGLVSKKRGQPSNRRYPDSFKEYTLHLVRNNYPDFGPTFACEKLAENHQLHVSVTTLRNWMVESEIWQSRKERKKRVYQPRNRRDCLGELIVRQVKQAEVVSNKRLGAVLKLIQEEQKEKSVQRSKRAPKRRGQKQIMKERQLNAAVLSSA